MAMQVASSPKGPWSSMGVECLAADACTGRGLPQVSANRAKSFQRGLRHVVVSLHLSLLTCKL